MGNEPGGHEEGENGLKWTDIARVLLMAAFIIGALVLLRATPWGKKLTSEDTGELRHLLGQWGWWSWALFALLGTLLGSIGLPRILLAFIGGALFGVWWGTVLAQIVATLAAAPAFLYTHFLGRELFVRKMGGRVRRFDQLLKKDGFTVILLIRLCPVGNAFLTNCLAGVSAIPFRTYLTASCIGFLPQTFIYAFLGGTSTGHSQAKLWFGVALLVVFSLLFLWFFKRSSLAREIVKIFRDQS